MALKDMFTNWRAYSTKTLFVLVGIVFAFAAFFSYVRIFLIENYLITVEAECDPSTESCFVYHCDPTAEECTGNPAEDTSYYKRITKPAHALSECERNGSCDFSCAPGDTECSEELCDPTGEDECLFDESFGSEGEETQSEDAPADMPQDESADASSMEDGAAGGSNLE